MGEDQAAGEREPEAALNRTAEPASKMFWFAVAATAAWSIAVLLGAFRWFGWPSVDTSKPLTLNEVGDLLSGLFAPLAFLWLFTATWLQRKELVLQRQELADTRAELKAQHGELARTAAENAEQTKLMHETTASARMREVYDEHKQRMYYAAQLGVRLSGRHLLNLHKIGAFAIFPKCESEQLTDVDRAIRGIADSCLKAEKLCGYSNYLYEEDFKLFIALSVELQSLGTLPRYTENPLIAARLLHLEIPELVTNMNKLIASVPVD